MGNEAESGSLKKYGFFIISRASVSGSSNTVWTGPASHRITAQVPELLETWEGEETRSRFTAYSMSSSVIRRNKELTLLDDKFEK
jgi:hypothetical protein